MIFKNKFSFIFIKVDFKKYTNYINLLKIKFQVAQTELFIIMIPNFNHA